MFFSTRNAVAGSCQDAVAVEREADRSGIVVGPRLKSLHHRKSLVTVSRHK